MQNLTDAPEIPDFQSLMLSVLQDAAQGEVRIGATVERLAELHCLSPAQRADLLPSGRQTTFANRVHWAKSYLGKAGLVELTKRAHFRISERGRAVLAERPPGIDIAYLTRFPEFREFRFASTEPAGTAGNVETSVSSLTPDEEMRRARDKIEAELAGEMLQRLVSASPEFF